MDLVRGQVMDLIGEHVMVNDDKANLQEARHRFRYPRTYTTSADNKKADLIGCVVLLAAFTFFVMGTHRNPLIFGVCALMFVLFIAYAFGSKLTLYPDKVEYQSLFFFKRGIPYHQISRWQLRVAYARNSEIFVLVVRSAGKRDLVAEIHFEMDAAFYAWFPQLEKLVDDMSMQYPGLQGISK
jgi:hypothetical protein